MRYYLFTTTKFSEEVIQHSIYGSSQSNWLANVDIGDIVFLSEFSYKNQHLFGHFYVNVKLFYDKEIIYPSQKYFFRVGLKPFKKVKIIEETEIFEYGLKNRTSGQALKLINLIQQNKHLHCINLTEAEGRFLYKIFSKSGENYILKSVSKAPIKTLIDKKELVKKNKLDRNSFFLSESDLETYLLQSLKDRKSFVFEQLSQTFKKHKSNNLEESIIFNQFIFDNAYPCDIAILNSENTNILELKKDKLSKDSLPQLKKEIEKHFLYSFSENRVSLNRQFNFYLICHEADTNNFYRKHLQNFFVRLDEKVKCLKRTNTFSVLEYKFDKELILKELSN